MNPLNPDINAGRMNVKINTRNLTAQFELADWQCETLLDFCMGRRTVLMATQRLADAVNANKKCTEPTSLGAALHQRQFLINRIRHAFMAGWSAAETAHAARGKEAVTSRNALRRVK